MKNLENTIYLGDNGWSNPQVGTWDSKLRVATLVTNIISSIEIISDTITLEGSGYKISQCDNGIVVTGKNNITIKNLIFENQFNNIVMTDCTNVEIINNAGFNSEGGVFLNSCRNVCIYCNSFNGFKLLTGINIFNGTKVEIDNNSINNARDFGIIIESCKNLSSTKNMVNNCNYSILCEGGDKNSISKNIIEGCSFGVQIKGSNNASVNSNSIGKASEVGVVVEGSNCCCVNDNNFDKCLECIRILGCSNCSVNYK